MTIETLGILVVGALQVVVLVLLWRKGSSAGGGDRVEKTLRDELRAARKESAEQQKSGRDELRVGLQDFSKTIDRRLDKLSTVVEQRLHRIQTDNTVQLEKMRQTVDEKLQATLERRLNDSFKLVSQRLEEVHKGLGEMQNLATGVGDLKRVLTNVKTRGTWGEIQLDQLLEQILSPEQYTRSVAVKRGSAERVDFAIRIPGKEGPDSEVLLPIDAKFPMEDYQRLVAAHEAADLVAAAEASKALENRIKDEAKKIQLKYLNPPKTTDFAILYLPVEGLYAEVTQRPGLAQLLQQQYRVSVAGPNTIAALLNSLQMGFRTLAIQQRTSEVWQVLSAVKTDFGRFGDILEKTRKKLEEASNTIDNATTKSRTIERKLGKMEQLQPGEAEPPKLINE